MPSHALFAEWGSVMSALLGLGLAAAALQFPSMQGIVGPNDYPSWATKAEASAAAYIRLVLDPSGKPAECRTIKTIGDGRLGTQICDIVRTKRIAPATLRDGTPVYSVIETSIDMFLPDTVQGAVMMKEQLTAAPDAELQVSRLPDGSPRAVVRVIVAFDATGKAVDCEPAGPGTQGAIQVLAHLACEQRDMFDGAVFKTRDGQAVPHVEARRIAFSTSSQQAATPAR